MNGKKRVLITGIAGFVGSHVAEEILKTTDWEIVGLARLNYAGDLHRMADSELYQDRDTADRVKMVYHDLKYVLNPGVVSRIGKVDYILHLAANSHVDRSITHPKEFFEDNVMGTVNLLEYMRLHQPNARLINFGTDEVFGPAPADYNFKEDDRYRPSNPYSGAKAGQMCAGHSYFVTYGLDIISTYTMNIFGERQNPEKLVALAIKRINEGTPIQIHCKLREGVTVFDNGTGHLVTTEPRDVEYVGERHWLHARNAANALVYLLENGVKGEHYNVVGDTELTNDEMVSLIGCMLNKDANLQYEDFHAARPGHDRRYALDGTKLKELGWIPPLDFESSLRNTIEWETKR